MCPAATATGKPIRTMNENGAPPPAASILSSGFSRVSKGAGLTEHMVLAPSAQQPQGCFHRRSAGLSHAHDWLQRLAQHWAAAAPWLGALLLAGLWLWRPVPVSAQGPADKSGVSPQVISLPSGPGSLEGLGESFEPKLSTGTASYRVPFEVAPGAAGFKPDLELVYNGGNAAGPWGIGWRLSVPYVQRRTDAGLPTYDDSLDQFVYSDGEKLVPLSNGDYRFENEGGFMRFRRLDAGGWEAHSPDGTRFTFGETEAAREITPYGTFSWKLERQIDTHGNEIHYFYLRDMRRMYLREARYNRLADGRYNAVIFEYEPRDDIFTDRRSRAPISIGLRGTRVQVWALGKLVRAYRFDYTAESSTGVHSLLARVTQIGDDGTSELPPHTFTYTQFDPEAYAVVTVENPPPVGLTSPDTDLVDVNGDSLPDIVHTPEQGHRFYLNRGMGRFQAEPVFPSQSPPDRLSSPGARMADMNGDGQVDLLVKAGTTAGAPFYYFAQAAGRPWEPGDRVDYNITPAFTLDDPDLRLLDANNDKRIDVVLTTPSQSYIWLAHADDTWSETADFAFPTLAVGTRLVFQDPRVKLGDMTSDRLQDLVFVRDGLVVYFPHNGNGDYGDGVRMLNPPQGLGDLDANIQLGDLNNDGLDDLVLPGNASVRYWLNLGDNSFADPVVLSGTPTYNQADTAVRLADIDGDGATELLYSRYPAPEEETLQYVDFHTGTQPLLLNSISNGLGRTFQISYRPSTSFYVDDWDAGRPWATALPFPVQVVSRLVVHDANSGDDYVTDYAYRDGYYDGVQKEFRGFAHSEQIEQGEATAPTTVTRSVFDTGVTNESRKGLLLERTVLAEGGACSGTFEGCYRREVNELTTRLLYDGGPEDQVAYSFISRIDTYLHENQAEPAHLRQTYLRDDYGNLTQHFNYGRVCGADLACGDDEVLEYSTYAINAADWIVNRSARVYQTDADGNFVSETRHYYDGEPYVGLPLGQVERGDLTRKEQGLDPTVGDRFIPTKRQAFDGYGNVVGMMDAVGNTTTVVYDALSHTFPVLERMHLEEGRALNYAASYHPGFGKLIAATDFNGHPSTYVYDTFGRLSKIVLPGDTLARPTQAFSYAPGSPRSAITTVQRVRSGTDEVLTSAAYFDGLGRPLQVRRQAEDGRVVVESATTFNARQEVAREYLPYFDAGLVYAPPGPDRPYTAYHYDPLRRGVRTVNPDGSFASTLYRPLTRVRHDAEDNRPDSPHAGTPTTMIYDGLERLVAVHELNRVAGELEQHETRYSYDGLGNRTHVVDAAGNVTTARSDGLSRRLALQHPDRGETVYTYDNNGNLIRTRDAKGQVIRYTYDAANRQVSEYWESQDGSAKYNAVYQYDDDLSPAHPDAQNTLGRLAYIEDMAGAIYFSYDARGNQVGTIRAFADEGLSLVVRRRFDARDELVELTYPDGAVQHFEYNARGLLDRVPGFVADLEYTPAGRREAVEYANGLTARYAYDDRLRLTQLQALRGPEPLQDLRYEFDAASNVVAITDARADRTPSDDQSASFTYDDLYRLTGASGAYGQIDYAYDPVGNMTHKSSAADPRLDLGEMRYGEGNAGPHALTSAAGQSYTYDANGNLVGAGSTTYEWDPLDRLTAIDDGASMHTYDYDASRQRVRQTVEQNGTTSTTLYADEVVEVRDGQLVRYVFADKQRIARVSVALDPDRLLHGFSDTLPAPADDDAERRWYLPDHLGSASLLLDESGQVTSRVTYYPFGLTRYATGGEALRYRFTGKERDASGLHYFEARYYDPLAGRFISVDPLFAEGPPVDGTLPQALNATAYGLNNPLKYVDPDGAEPDNRIVILNVQAKQPWALTITPKVPDYGLYGPHEIAAKKEIVEYSQSVQLTVFPRGGGKAQTTYLRYQAEVKFHPLPGAQAKPTSIFKRAPGDPGAIKRTAICVVNNCLVGSRHTGRTERVLRAYKVEGTAEITLSPRYGGQTFTVGSAEKPVVFYFWDEVKEVKLKDKKNLEFGVGVNVGGWDPESFTHIVTPSGIHESQGPQN
jgi:RHS repeat-associated protein